MTEDLWTKVDEYITETLHEDDPNLEHVLKNSGEARLPPINVSKPIGRFLYMLVKTSGAVRVLEIGTLGGYSAVCMAKALPESGRLITLDNNPVCIRVARKNFRDTGFENIIELREGEALDTLAAMNATGETPFDFIFLDANKPDYPDYLEHCLKLSKPGTVILADNTVRGGDVLNADSDDYSVQGVRRMHEIIKNDPRLEATAIQTVGEKGHDGFTLARVKD